MVAAATFAKCEGRPFELYQPIIESYLFGPPPDDPTLPPESAKKGGAQGGAEGEGEVELTPDQAELQQSITVSVLNIEPGGRVMVGFTDVSANPQKHYYMEVGEERDGWTVKSADPVTEEVVLAKSSVEITRKLGEKAAGAKGGKKGAAAAMPPRGGTGAAMPGRSPILAGRNGRIGGPQGLESMKSRRQLKHEQEEADRKARLEQAEATKKIQEEAERQREQAEAEREAEREERKQMLLDIQEQLRKAREENQRRREDEMQEGHADEENNP